MKDFELVPISVCYSFEKESTLFDRLLAAGKLVTFSVITAFSLGMLLYTCLAFSFIHAFATQSNITLRHNDISSKIRLEAPIVEELVPNYSIHVNYADSVYGASDFFASIVFDGTIDTDNIKIELNIHNGYYEIIKINDGVFGIKSEHYNPARSDVQITIVDGDGTVIFRE